MDTRKDSREAFWQGLRGSPRQDECLALLQAGLTPAQIAREMRVTPARVQRLREALVRDGRWNDVTLQARMAQRKARKRRPAG